MTQPLNLPKKVPLLPGFQFSDPFVSLTSLLLPTLLIYGLKQNFHKTQQFSYVNKTNQGKTDLPFLNNRIQSHIEKENFTKEPLDYDLLSSMKNNEPPKLTCTSRFLFSSKN